MVTSRFWRETLLQRFASGVTVIFWVPCAGMVPEEGLTVAQSLPAAWLRLVTDHWISSPFVLLSSVTVLAPPPPLPEPKHGKLSDGGLAVSRGGEKKVAEA